MKRRVRSSPAPAGRAERRHLVFLHPAGTSRRRTGCRCWRSTASTSGSRPSSASWRSSSANRIPPSPSKFLSDNRCHRTRRHLQDATMNPSSTTLHMLREKQNIFRRYFMVCRETLGNLPVCSCSVGFASSHCRRSGEGSDFLLAGRTRRRRLEELLRVSVCLWRRVLGGAGRVRCKKCYLHSIPRMQPLCCFHLYF